VDWFTGLHMRDVKITNIELPTALYAATKLAAERGYINVSSYIRRALAAAVKADGINPHTGEDVGAQAEENRCG
jgi:hypothetical protein